MKVRIALLAMSIARFANANSVGTIVDVSHMDAGDINNTGISALHYFDRRELRGPLDQFSFINSNSFVSASYFDSDFGNDSSISGQWYSDNGFFVGAGYSYSDPKADNPFSNSLDIKTGTLGYQANEVWSVSATFVDPEDADSVTLFNVSYEHDMDGNDWIAFSYRTDDELDFHNVTTRYFNSLDNGSYLVLTADVTDVDDGNSDWNLRTDYYWNNYTSVFASVGDDDTYQVGAQHYFNDTWALSASYLESDLNQEDIWQVNLRAQF